LPHRCDAAGLKVFPQFLHEDGGGGGGVAAEGCEMASESRVDDQLVLCSLGGKFEEEYFLIKEVMLAVAPLMTVSWANDGLQMRGRKCWTVARRQGCFAAREQ
jgi:hypothetical protein